MKILIFGGTGLIGREVRKNLELGGKHEVCYTGRKENHQEIGYYPYDSSDPDHYISDVIDLANPDVIINCISSHGNHLPADEAYSAYRDDLLVPSDILACIKKTQRFINLNSTEIYNGYSGRPDRIERHMNPYPNNPYGYAKTAIFQQIKQARKEGYNAMSLVLPYIVPRDRGTLWSFFRALINGGAVRFTDINDEIPMMTLKSIAYHVMHWAEKAECAKEDWIECDHRVILSGLIGAIIRILYRDSRRIDDGNKTSWFDRDGNILAFGYQAKIHKSVNIGSITQSAGLESFAEEIIKAIKEEKRGN